MFHLILALAGLAQASAERTDKILIQGNLAGLNSLREPGCLAVIGGSCKRRRYVMKIRYECWRQQIEHLRNSLKTRCMVRDAGFEPATP
ncbi:hypothetical protein BH20VER1_BH20VER1_02400 [soil metagenome]